MCSFRFQSSYTKIHFYFYIMPLPSLNSIAQSFTNTATMPVLFVGHGSPMNAIEENEFVASFRKVGQSLPKPQAILCISAHWETRGTMVTAMEQPRTIHDFRGFPKELFAVQYPAPGSPELARFTKTVVTQTAIRLDEQWGLDHGAWSVIKHLYPAADVPVIQMSIDFTQGPAYHYELGKQLMLLRNKGVLIIGSGNMVHNLRMVAWNELNTVGFGYDWALEAREKMNAAIMRGDHQSLINFKQLGRAFELAIPSAEHFLPLLYTLALQQKGEAVSLFNDAALGGSLTMTSVKIG